jgi:hypothetical protein
MVCPRSSGADASGWFMVLVSSKLAFGDGHPR